MNDRETSDGRLLKVERLTKVFGGLRAVDDVSFDVARREILGLIGPNGSGKTTVYNVIAGFYPATSGRVLFKGEDITNLPAHEIAHKGLLRTFQLVRVFPEMTVLENMMMGAQPKRAENVLAGLFQTPLARRERAQVIESALRLLDVVGMTPHANVLAADLPFAEQKMVEITRALMSDPDLILLDEPASGILPSTVERILSFIRQLREERGQTFVIVEHNMRVIMNVCDRIVVLNAGRKIAEGTPQEISHNPDVIRAYLGE